MASGTTILWQVKVTTSGWELKDPQIVTKVIMFLLDAYQAALNTLPVLSVWLESLVSPNAVIWYVLGLLTLPFLQKIRIRFYFWRMESRLAPEVKGKPGRLKSSAMRIFSEAYPNAPIELPKEEIENVLGILARIVEIGGSNPSNDWRTLWSEVNSGWKNRFVSKCRLIHEPPLQEALARAFVYEAITPSRLDHRCIDILAAISIQDWKTFTAICSFACSIDGHMTPVVFNYNDDVYKKAGLNAEAQDGLIASGLVTQGGMGDIYIRVIPDNGLRVSYFREEELIVMPPSEPIPWSFFERSLSEPNPLDEKLNVGVVDFTEVGRVLGCLTPCSKVDGFVHYLKGHWAPYLHDEKSIR